jgi:predicted amidophosphoribosyltransferase
VCRRGYPNDYIQCPDDKEYLIPYSVFRAMKTEEKAKKGKGKICPVCQKTYDDSEQFCAEDGSKLENIQ